MLSRSEFIRLIGRALILVSYIIAITLYCMFREMKQKAITALSNLRLFKRGGDQFSSITVDNEYQLNTTGHVFTVDGSPSLSPIPNDIVTAAIKLSLPIVRYGDFLVTNSMQDESNKECVVCCECVERNDEIRDLRNCKHVFHRDCLDNWLEIGQILCPLCRSMLLPPLTNPWAVVMESNSSE